MRLFGGRGAGASAVGTGDERAAAVGDAGAAPHRRASLRRGLAVAVIAALSPVLAGCSLIETLSGGSSSASEATSADAAQATVAPRADLQPYYSAALDWQPCGKKRECATAKAPMDWNDPSKGDVELALVRIKASGTSKGSLFTNPGGPGASGFDLVDRAGEALFDKPLLENYDLVGWDPRGVGRSTPVTCLDDKGMDDYVYGVPTPAPKTDAEIIAEATAKATRFAQACADNTGPVLAYVDTISTVRDLDLLRALVHDAKLNYFGFSYGTAIGAHYADLFPQNVGRMVLDGAMDPTVGVFETILEQQRAFGDAARAWLGDCFTGSTCPFTHDADAAIAQINDLMAKADDRLPTNADGRKLTSSVISTAINDAMYSESSWPDLTAAFAAYMQQGDPSGFFALSDSYYDRDPSTGRYMSNMFAAFPAVNCLDYPRVTDPAVIAQFNRDLAAATPIGVAGPDSLGDVQCDVWKYPATGTLDPVRGTGAAPIVVVGTTGDPATPYHWAESLAQQLESGVLLTFEGEGHTAYGQGDSCVDGKIDDYFVSGTVPEDGVRC